jgi:hypothetical protein
MNNQSVQMLQNILEALMTISTKGNDTITMSNILQALQNVIDTESNQPAMPELESITEE